MNGRKSIKSESRYLAFSRVLFSVSLDVCSLASLLQIFAIVFFYIICLFFYFLFVASKWSCFLSIRLMINPCVFSLDLLVEFSFIMFLRTSLFPISFKLTYFCQYLFILFFPVCCCLFLSISFHCAHMNFIFVVQSFILAVSLFVIVA